MKRGIFVCLAILFISGMIGCGDESTNPPTGGGQPTISSVTPNQLSRGQKDATVSIQGTNLNGVTSVSLGDGITVHQFTGISAVQIDVRCSVAANAAAGNRTVTVNTTHGSVSSSTHFSISNNRAPEAKFSVSATKGAKNTTFEFDASASSDPDGTISGYRWEFGDGATANGKKTTHKYSSAGKFQVKLLVTDNNQATDSAGKEIEVIDGIAPVARFTVSPSSGTVDTVFQFDASASSDSDGSIRTYQWAFGDGKKAEGKIVTHKYSTGRTFNVRLTVTDNDGIQDTQDREIRVENKSDQEIYQAINATIYRFFELFSKLDKLTAEEILSEGWSNRSDCPGKAREMRIINDLKTKVKSSNANVTSIETFLHADRQKADSRVVARFDTVFKDNSRQTGKATHVFDMIKEGEKWNICNFVLEKFEED